MCNLVDSRAGQVCSLGCWASHGCWGLRVMVGTDFDAGVEVFQCGSAAQGGERDG